MSDRVSHSLPKTFQSVVLNGHHGFQSINIEDLFANRPDEPKQNDLDPGYIPEEVIGLGDAPFSRSHSPSLTSLSSLTSLEDSGNEGEPIAYAGQKRRRPDSSRLDKIMKFDSASPQPPAPAQKVSKKPLPPLKNFNCEEIKGRDVDDVLNQIEVELKSTQGKEPHKEEVPAPGKRRNFVRHLKALRHYIQKNKVLPVFPAYRQKHIDVALKNSTRASSNLGDFKTSQGTAWQGNGSKKAIQGKAGTTLDKLKASGFKHLVVNRGETLLVGDSETRILVVASAPPENDEWNAAVDGGRDAIEAKSQSLDMRKMPKGDSRGDYSLYTVGLGSGGGRQMPAPVAAKVNAETYREVSDLYENPHIQALVGRSTTLFKTYGGRMHDYYRRNLHSVYRHRGRLGLQSGKLPCGFPFATSTINFGPKTVTKPHFDSKNLAFGWCNVIVYGDFDHLSSGLIVLHTLKLVISAPPGTCLLIPSALVEHYNLDLKPNETRYSLTFYTAADLFRYVYNGYATDTELINLHYSTKKRKLEFDALAEEVGALRVAEGKARFTKLSELTNLTL